MKEEKSYGDAVYEGNFEGYDVYVSYATEGLEMEEAYALYQEACSSILYRSLAQMAQEEKE